MCLQFTDTDQPHIFHSGTRETEKQWIGKGGGQLNSPNIAITVNVIGWEANSREDASLVWSCNSLNEKLVVDA